MNYGSLKGRKAALVAAAAALALAIPVGIYAQGRRGRGPAGPTPSGKAGAAEDLTGYWVSIVTEDWRFRMVTPAKGDYASVPISAEGRKVADAWDPAKDHGGGRAVPLLWRRRTGCACRDGCTSPGRTTIR